MKRTLIILVALFSTQFFVTDADAFPPRLGIDLSTVLKVRDQARKAKYLSNKPVVKNLRTVKTIVLDPGHGGENEGALGVADIQEKFLTMELAYDLRDAIQEKYPTVRVVMTRYWDRELSLSERARIANFREADLFLSLHYNAATHNRASGFETYFLKSNWVTPKTTSVESAKKDADQGGDVLKTLVDLKRQRRHKHSGKFAHAIQKGLESELSSLDAIDRGVKQENFTVLRGARMPAVVVEAGFLTHTKEGESVVTEAHREKVVKAMLLGIEAFDDSRAKKTKK